MDTLSRIGRNLLPELSQQPLSEELSLARTSLPLVSDDCVTALSQLMAETQARYPNQVLPEGTPDMYLADWERMVRLYGRRNGKFDERTGLTCFRDALLRTLQDRERPRFFPDPLEIEDRLRAAARARREDDEAQAAIAKLDEARAQWERDRAADIANGIERAPLHAAPVRSPRKVLPARHSEQEIAAFVAQNVKPEELEAVRERMRMVLGATPQEVPAQTVA